MQDLTLVGTDEDPARGPADDAAEPVEDAHLVGRHEHPAQRHVGEGGGAAQRAPCGDGSVVAGGGGRGRHVVHGAERT